MEGQAVGILHHHAHAMGGRIGERQRHKLSGHQMRHMRRLARCGGQCLQDRQRRFPCGNGRLTQGGKAQDGRADSIFLAADHLLDQAMLDQFRHQPIAGRLVGARQARKLGQPDLRA